jgi:hypothetical protein
MITPMTNGHLGPLMRAETNYSVFVTLADSTQQPSRKTVAETDLLVRNSTLSEFEEPEGLRHTDCL